MATPIIELPLGESNLNSDAIGEPSKTNEAKDIPPKTKATKTVLNASCLCMSVNGVCTCIHLNGNFNRVQIKNVLDLINTPLCEAGPSTSSYNSIKRRKLPSSESSDERLTVVESKKVCKALDSDDLDSDDCDDMENENDYSTLRTSNLAKIEQTKSGPASTGTTVPPNPLTHTTEPLSPSSMSTLSSTSISSPSITSSNSSPARDGDRTRSPDRSNLLSFIRIINSAFSEQDHGDRDNSDDPSNSRGDHDSLGSDDDDDDDEDDDDEDGEDEEDGEDSTGEEVKRKTNMTPNPVSMVIRSGSSEFLRSSSPDSAGAAVISELANLVQGQPRQFLRNFRPPTSRAQDMVESNLSGDEEEEEEEEREKER
uniref:Uncharacterized protein n=1 Tax=Cacopsylla melanoneura TaxID=428564 RepID=A0A8D8S1Q5_9HEMI